MAADEMFDSAVCSSGDLAGVFEYDGDTGYFYLYKPKNEDSRKLVDAIQVLAGTADFEEGDIAVRWDTTESKVGLFIRGQLWAVFDSRTGQKYGGAYRAAGEAAIPPTISRAFKGKTGVRAPLDASGEGKNVPNG